MLSLRKAACLICICMSTISSRLSGDRTNLHSPIQTTRSHKIMTLMVKKFFLQYGKILTSHFPIIQKIVCFSNLCDSLRLHFSASFTSLFQTFTWWSVSSFAYYIFGSRSGRPGTGLSLTQTFVSCYSYISNCPTRLL